MKKKNIVGLRNPVDFQKQLDNLIQERSKEGLIDIGKISDGYHTFDELYEHRYRLWITLCNYISIFNRDNHVIRSRKNHDGSHWEGWFVLAVNTKQGQLSYHLPEIFWDDCNFALTKEQNYDYDGHTSQDVLERLKSI